MKRFIIKNKEIRANAVKAVLDIRGEPTMEVIIREYKEDHTRDQENFFHLLCRLLSVETGYHEGEIKELVKKNVLGTKIITVGSAIKEVTESSADKDKAGYSELITGIYRIAGEGGFILPPPQYRDK